jgi:hypothetical protein
MPNIWDADNQEIFSVLVELFVMLELLSTLVSAVAHINF